MQTDSDFQLGEWQVQPAMNTLRRGDSETRIEPRSMDLLVYLACHGGEVVSAEDILEHVWPGLVVGDQSIYQGIARLRKALGDDSSHPRYIETLSKRGYRLIAAVTWTEPENSASAATEMKINAAKTLAENTKRSARTQRLLVAGLLVAALLVSTLADFFTDKELTLHNYSSVAVLPFTNVAEDSENDYFAEGLAAELIDALGQIDGLRVLGRASSFRMRSDEKDAAEIGRLLGADALVEGSVRRSGDRLKVFIQVIDAAGGHRIWSKNYERKLVDVFEIQEEIAQHLAAALHSEIKGLPPKELTDLPPASIEAYDYYLLGRYYRGRRDVSGLERALSMYQKALALDQNYPPAYRGIGVTYLLMSFYGDLTLARAVEQAEPYLDKAMQLTPTDARTVGAIGLSHYLMGEYGLAEDYLRQAVGINPNYAEGWMWLGLAIENQGRLNEAFEHLQKATRLEPLMVTVQINHANALKRLGRGDEAGERLERLAQSILDSAPLYRSLAALARERGQLQKAKKWSRMALNLNPKEASSAAGMALSLVYIGQNDQALEWAELALQNGFPGEGARQLLERVYLNLGDADRLKSLADEEQALFNREDMPEIDWRRMSAHAGMANLLLGHYEAAVTALEKALQDGVYTIVETDFDLIYCTSLGYAYARIGKTAQTQEWAGICRRAYDTAKREGWNNHWMEYAAARLAIIENRPSEAIDRLEQMVSNGFRGRGLIANAPIFAGIRSEPRVQRLLDELKVAIEAASR